MGIDASVCVEKKIRFFKEEKKENVNIGCYKLNRNTEFFQALSDNCTPGYPTNITDISKDFLQNNEDYGECYCSYDTLMSISKKHSTIDDKYFLLYSSIKPIFIFRFDW